MDEVLGTHRESGGGALDFVTVGLRVIVVAFDISGNLCCSSFMGGWIGVIGTVLGTLLGSGITFLTQRQALERDRAERDNNLRKQTALDFLADVQAMYDVLAKYYRSAEHNKFSSKQQPETVSTYEAQQALDSVRMINSQDVIELAEELWGHLRSHHVGRGEAKSAEEVANWKKRYWTLRKRLLNQARLDIGLTRLGDPARVTEPAQL